MARQSFMSTTQSPSAATVQSSSLRDLYDALIFDNPEVCNSCHAVIRDKETHDTDRLGTGNRPDSTLLRAGEGVVGYDVEIHNAYGTQRSYHARTYCGNCGQPGGAAPNDPTSRKAMLDAVDALVDRFTTAGIPINDDRLKRYVGHLKSQERFDGAEHEIWRVATAKAIRNARIRDCVRATYGREK